MTAFMNNDESLGRVYQYTSLCDRVLRTRHQKRNKVLHGCEYCKEIIPVNEGSIYITGLESGRFYNYHVHLHCY
jgi:hypothetical protein